MGACVFLGGLSIWCGFPEAGSAVIAAAAVSIVDACALSPFFGVATMPCASDPSSGVPTPFDFEGVCGIISPWWAVNRGTTLAGVAAIDEPCVECRSATVEVEPLTWLSWMLRRCAAGVTNGL